MSLFSREKAQKLRERVLDKESERGQRLAGGLWNMFNELHSMDYYEDREIEELLLEQKKHEIKVMDFFKTLPKDVVTFSPSGAGKCRRELVYKAQRAKKDEVQRYPYQRRWTRNSTVVHGAVQTDLLYAEKKLAKPIFTVARMKDNGLPAWESNLKTVKRISHKGVDFAVYGMMDGVLIYTPDGSKIGFEFKTKSTTIGTVGHYKMKDAGADHKLQCVAYSILFGIDEYIITYESVAKDGWTKGKEAKPDLRTFYHRVTEEDRQELLDKWAETAKAKYNNELPERELDKCIFCPYKTVCEVADNE